MASSPRHTLLVVDDEPEVLQSVYDLLRLDYRVLTSERGREALAILEREDVQVVMSDQRMPDMSGVEFLDQVRRLKPEVPRLLFTGYADIKAVIDAINLGHVFRYVTKPWDPDELATVIRQAVEHHVLIVERKRLVAELRTTNHQLAEADRLKGAFIEVASHELNTPVAVVLGLTELWKMTQGPEASPAQRGWIDRIHGAGKRLAGTVERMLKLLRTDRLDHTLDPTETELIPLINRVVYDLQPFLQARRQEVRIKAEPDLGSAEIDPAKVGDILTNLIANAIKFSPDDASIDVEAGSVGPDLVWFRVVDAGVGIGQAECRHLFEPFFTGYDTLHHSSGEYQYCKRGIGLGLWLVKTFVELHGGTVNFTSAPERGSTFIFTLPRRRAGQDGANPALAGASIGDLGGPRVGLGLDVVA